MNPVTARSLVDDSIELSSLPDLYFQVSEMIHDPRYSLEDISQVIGKDPALSARLLKIVNSSFYGFQATIDTLSRAIVVVGIDDLNNMILATSVVDTFSRIPCDLVDMTTFWLRSVRCGVICKMLAKASLVLHCERLFLAGLLHDIGSLVLYRKLPDASSRVLLAAGNDRNKIFGLEQEIIGFSHAEVGSELLKRWGLPESLYLALAGYANPSLAREHKLDSYLLSLAVQLANGAEQGVTAEQVVEKIDPAGLTLTRLNEDQIVMAADQANATFVQVFELLAPRKKFH